MNHQNIRKGNSRARDTRQRILRAAAELFALTGFHATTTKKIAKKAGVVELSIFNHFRTKRRLYGEVLEWKMREFAEQTVAVDTQDPRELLEHLIDLRKDNSQAMRLFSFAGLEGFPEFKMMLRRWRESYVEHLVTLIERQKKAGTVAEDVPAVPAALALTAFALYEYRMYDLYKAESLLGISRDELTNFYYRLWSHGVAERAPKKPYKPVQAGQSGL